MHDIPLPEEDGERILRLLEAVPAIVEHRLRRCYRRRGERHRAGQDAVGDVFLALAGRSDDATRELVAKLAGRAAWRIQAGEKRRRCEPLEEGNELSHIATDDEAEALRERRLAIDAWLQEGLLHLDGDEATAFEMWLDGVSDLESAAVLGWSRQKVRKRRSRAYQRIREMVKGGVIPSPPPPPRG